MLCENCKQKPATIYFTKIVNDERLDIHLCEECAKQNSQISLEYPFTINNFLAGLFDMPLGYQLKETQTEQRQPQKCNKCGLTFEEFKRSGKFGCAECYNVFNDKLGPILKRLHGNTHHSGKLPQRSGGAIKIKKEIEKLKSQLNKYVQEEEYEKAAKVRDKIKELEKSNIEGKG